MAANLSSTLRTAYCSDNSSASFVLDGWLYERWCLKVLANVFAAGWTERGKAQPPKEIVELIFGRRRLAGSSGLYSVNYFTGRDKGTDEFIWNVLLDSETKSQICGILTSMRGFLTLVTIPQGNPEPLIRAIGRTQRFDFTEMRLTRHPRGLSYEVGKEGFSKKLEISMTWP